MAKDQKVTLRFTLTDDTTRDVAFTVPAGADGTQPLQHSISGNFSLGVADNPQRDAACGRAGSGAYLKTTATLYQAPQGVQAVTPLLVLNEIPCNSDGTPIAYSTRVDTVKVAAGRRSTVGLWVFMPTVPTHKYDPVTKTVSELKRADSGVSGLPTIPADSLANEISYTLNYIHT